MKKIILVALVPVFCFMAYQNCAKGFGTVSGGISSDSIKGWNLRAVGTPKSGSIAASVVFTPTTTGYSSTGVLVHWGETIRGAGVGGFKACHAYQSFYSQRCLLKADNTPANPTDFNSYTLPDSNPDIPDRFGPGVNKNGVYTPYVTYQVSKDTYTVSQDAPAANKFNDYFTVLIFSDGSTNTWKWTPLALTPPTSADCPTPASGQSTSSSCQVNKICENGTPLSSGMGNVAGAITVAHPHGWVGNINKGDLAFPGYGIVRWDPMRMTCTKGVYSQAGAGYCIVRQIVPNAKDSRCFEGQREPVAPTYSCKSNGSNPGIVRCGDTLSCNAHGSDDQLQGCTDGEPPVGCNVLTKPGQFQWTYTGSGNYSFSMKNTFDISGVLSGPITQHWIGRDSNGLLSTVTTVVINNCVKSTGKSCSGQSTKSTCQVDRICDNVAHTFLSTSTRDVNVDGSIATTPANPDGWDGKIVQANMNFPGYTLKRWDDMHMTCTNGVYNMVPGSGGYCVLWQFVDSGTDSRCDSKGQNP